MIGNLVKHRMGADAAEPVLGVAEVALAAVHDAVQKATFRIGNLLADRVAAVDIAGQQPQAAGAFAPTMAGNGGQNLILVRIGQNLAQLIVARAVAEGWNRRLGNRPPNLSRKTIKSIPSQFELRHSQPPSDCVLVDLEGYRAHDDIARLQGLNLLLASNYFSKVRRDTMNGGDQSNPQSNTPENSLDQAAADEPAKDIVQADETVTASPAVSADDTPSRSASQTGKASAAESASESESVPAAETAAQTAAAPAPASGLARGRGPLAARGLGVAKPASPQVSNQQLVEKQKDKPKKKSKPKPKPAVAGGKSESPTKPTVPQRAAEKVAVPNLREGLPSDVQAELDATLADADVEALLGGAAGMPNRQEPLAEGDRVHGQVLKIHDDSVFVSLGGPDEGTVPFEQFTDAEPSPGDSIEVLVRGFNSQDGLYSLSLPGQTIDVTDWSDLDEGAIVEVTVTGHNAGGLECKVGGVRGFIPISQVSEYRVEDLAEFVDQKFVCLVTEANANRGNLVLSRRAILEREREEKRREQLEKIEPGQTLEGIVRSVKDFGAFVDLGGLDGLIHVSKLSWDRIKHPSDVIEVGQKVKVKIDSVNKETGKISLSYRDLLVNPWDTAEQEFAVGSVHKGTVTRIADFGCFVRLTAGVEGLVHISELAHHRVSRVDTLVSEGQEVEVKILSFDRDSQKIGLSMKAAQTAPEQETSETEGEATEPPRDVAVKAAHSGPLKGGNDRQTGGERFGLRW